MASFPTAVNPPSNYGPPNMAQWLSSFLSSSIGDLPQDYYQGKFNAQKGQENDLVLQQQQQQAAIAKAFPNGLPTDPQTGQLDSRKITKTIGDLPGGLNYLQTLSPFLEKQGAGTLSPLLGGSAEPAGTPAALPPAAAGGATTAPPASAGLAQPTGMSANAERITQGGDGEGPTVKQFVSARLPNGNSAQAGDLETRIATQMGLDPNAPMTAGQQRRALGLLNRYAGTNEAAPANGAPAATTAPTFTVPPTATPNAGSPAERVAQGFGGLPPQNQPLQAQPQVQAAQPAQPQVPPNRSGLPPATAAVLAPQQPQGQQRPPNAPLRADPVQPQPGANAGPAGGAPGPVGPQVPLPRGFTDPEKAIMALRREAATNPHPRQAQMADQWAQDIEKSIQPRPVSQSQTLIDPRTGQVVYQGAFAGGRSTLSPDALEGAAERYLQTGQFPTGMGRGIQGVGDRNAIMARAAEKADERGIDQNELPTRWQQFATQAAGRRVLQTRAANLTLAENEAETLIPRVRQASANVSRTQYPSLNSVILAAKQGTGDPNVIKLSVAASALIPVYARVLKPNGQITEGDTGRATEILNKAWSDGQINAALDQMQVELKSARTALTQTVDEYGMPRGQGEGGQQTRGQGQQQTITPPPANVTKWVRRPDGSLGPAQ